MFARLAMFAVCICVALSGATLAPDALQPAAEAQSTEEIIRATWPDSEEDFAIYIAACESGLGADIYNEASASYGIFQMMPETAAGMGFDYYALSDPWYASWTAARLQDAYGWSPWACAY